MDQGLQVLSCKTRDLSLPATKNLHMNTLVSEGFNHI